MKRKRLLLAIAALIAAAGLWFARSGSHPNDPASEKLAADPATFTSTSDNSKSGEMTNAAPRLAPPDQTRKFREFTPEQRVEFARKGHGPGG